jgi:hypothetical protein
MPRFIFPLLTALLLALPPGLALAEECGPSCPVCSGNSGSGVVLGRNTLLFSGLLIPTGEDEQGVLNLRYGALDWLDAGVGWTVKSRKPLWSLKARVIEERVGGWIPALVVGTGSVQIGGNDQSVYVQAHKSFQPHDLLGLQFSAGTAMLVPEVDRVYGLAGVTASLGERFAFFASFDGRSFHEGASLIPTEWLSISVMLVESEHLAASVALRHRFGG